MDYRTFFFTNVVSVSAFAVCLGVLALRNRRVTGLKWLAAALLVAVAKLVMQGLEGRTSPLISDMLTNESYPVSFILQFMGLRWFLVRKPLQSRWPWWLLGFLIVLYTGLFLARVPYSGNVMDIFFVGICAASAWMLLSNGREPFVAVSRAAAAILIADFFVSGYRAVLTNINYKRPWETVNAQADPRWLYSLACMAFLATLMMMCDIWFVVTELDRELVVQARTDPLTGALNRRALEDAALRETARSVRHGIPLCMIMIDIDHFKRLNDRYGHAAGDRVLQELVTQVKGTLRVQDLLARTGGEEFTILMPDSPIRTGLAVAERLRRLIEKLEVPLVGKSVHITVSAGVAQLEPANGGWEELMRRADEAMYKAKACGRNTVEVDALDICSLLDLEPVPASWSYTAADSNDSGFALPRSRRC
jgi:diguanylate cyclase (GGDEF)-like protein